MEVGDLVEVEDHQLVVPKLQEVMEEEHYQEVEEAVVVVHYTLVEEEAVEPWQSLPSSSALLAPNIVQ